MVTLDIFSDPVCPWCHVGKAHLDQALAQAGEHPFVIAWHPFQLNPDMPAGGADRRSYMAARFGGTDRVAAAEARLVEQAAASGVLFDFDRIARVPNTLDAHRLIHWAGIEARQDTVVSALFQAYFVAGRDIGDREVLCDIADGAGLDAALIARLLASGADLADIRARDAIELYAPSKVTGALHAPAIFIDRGVQFEGSCKMESAVAERGGAKVTLLSGQKDGDKA